MYLAFHATAVHYESTDDQSYSIPSKEDVKAEFELVKVLLNINKIIIIGNNGIGCRLLAEVHSESSFSVRERGAQRQSMPKYPRQTVFTS